MPTQAAANAVIVEQLAAAPLFRGVPETDLAALVNAMRRESFPPDHVLFRKGDPGDTLYLVLEGQVRIFTQDEQGVEITLAYQGPTRIFGDFSIFDQQPRSASAATTGNVEVLSLRREDFLTFLPSHPSVGLAMIRNLTQQVRHVTTFLSQVRDSLEHVVQGDFDRAIAEMTASTHDADILRVTRAFIDMVHTVRQRAESTPPTESQPPPPQQP